MAPNLKPLKTR